MKNLSSGRRDITGGAMKISPELSAYLDLIRFAAAIAVLFGHLQQDGVAVGWGALAAFSHEAVVIFFVLSGFIICSNTMATQPTARTYAVARLSRIYSVALPAIIFSLLLSWVVAQGTYGSLPKDYRPFAWNDLLGSLLFLNESWTNPAQLTLNDPYWSLCYEVWFYILFAAYFFNRGRSRWWLVALLSFAAGPAIIAMLPIWVLGAWAACWHQRAITAPQKWAWPIFFLAPMVIALVNGSGLDVMVRSWLKELIPPMWRLESSQRFLTDYLLGIVVCLHLLAFQMLPQGFKSFFLNRRAALSYLAGFSFTLYLFHRPLTQAAGILFKNDGGVVASVLTALAIVLTCWAISFLTERQLPAWRRMMARLLRETGAIQSPART